MGRWAPFSREIVATYPRWVGYIFEEVVYISEGGGLHAQGEGGLCVTKGVVYIV